MHLGRLIPAAVALAILIGSGPAPAAPLADDDADEDTVADELDVCDETPTGDLVDADGCSVCPCDDGGWTSHRSYVRCVAGEARRRVLAGRAERRPMHAAVRIARRSTCGRAEMTRCCVYASEDADVGVCRIMRVADCDALGDRAEADDEGTGSCVPNPCVY
ncbi:MAG TPA: hypothetical protein VKA21_11745 [Candidatus Binatia bacterium]|nr:hypothetical protein [Candidatus Binatia bacterium]